MLQFHRSHYAGMGSPDRSLISALSNMKSELCDEN